MSNTMQTVSDKTRICIHLWCWRCYLIRQQINISELHFTSTSDQTLLEVWIHSSNFLIFATFQMIQEFALQVMLEKWLQCWYPDRVWPPSSSCWPQSDLLKCKLKYSFMAPAIHPKSVLDLRHFFCLCQQVVVCRSD